MKWKRTVNPRVFETETGFYRAFAVDSGFGEGGYVAHIYQKPLQRGLFGDPLHELVPGTAKWGAEIESALRVCIRAYDPEAELPEREKVLP